MNLTQSIGQPSDEPPQPKLDILFLTRDVLSDEQAKAFNSIAGLRAQAGRRVHHAMVFPQTIAELSQHADIQQISANTKLKPLSC